jgi:choline dehydrogenase-like flavoprotein
MLSDAVDLQPDTTLETDICIIGGGPAGISIALAFDGLPVRVLLLEGGKLKYHRPGQALYKGADVGLHYEDLDHSRSRIFGGSSNCWAGFCRPLDSHDFQQREWVPNSGWPISRSDLDGFYPRAHELLQLGPFDYDPEAWKDWIDRADLRLLNLDGQRAINVIAQMSPPTRFGQHYRNAIARSSNISTYFDATVTEIEAPGNGATVTGLRGRTLAGGEFRVTARTYVLAAGGIETPRLLLASNRHQPAGVGNQNDNVGRYFMDHPRLISGGITFSGPEETSRIYDMHSVFARRAMGQGVRLSGFFGLTPETQRAERVGNTRCYVKSQFLGGSHEATRALIMLLRSRGEKRTILERSWPDILKMIAHVPQMAMLVAGLAFNPAFLRRKFALEMVVEPTPLPDSRVTLLPERDALGMPRVQVDWRLGDLEKRTMRRTMEILGEELSRQGHGTVVANAPGDDDPWPSTLNGCWHHMGTARMHADPRKGVVDGNCRVHGMENLFVSSGAILPTVGSDTPTINIVALALRLADHLKGQYGLGSASAASH